MPDLKKLNNMLDAALESETPESLNRWIEEQMQADWVEVCKLLFWRGDFERTMTTFAPITDIHARILAISERLSFFDLLFK